MKALTLCALLALLAALPAAAQSTDEALPPPDVSKHAEALADEKAPPQTTKVKRVRLMTQALSGTIRGPRDRDEGPLTVELEGLGALPIQGELLGILRDRARNRTLNLRVILELGADDKPSAALIVSAEATAQRELPIYEVGDDVGHDAPIAALAIGDTCWVHGGRAYVFMGSKAGKGKVLLSGLRFGTRAVEANDDQAVHGLLTHDGEDDPIEEAPMFTRGGETLPLVGPLVGLLRERARNRRVSLQGERTADGFRATAIRAVVTRTTVLKDDQPMGYLKPGAEVWVTGGRVYVQVISEKGEGTVAAGDLSFGERPAPGVIDALQGNDD